MSLYNAMIAKEMDVPADCSTSAGGEKPPPPPLQGEASAGIGGPPASPPSSVEAFAESSVTKPNNCDVADGQKLVQPPANLVIANIDPVSASSIQTLPLPQVRADNLSHRSLAIPDIVSNEQTQGKKNYIRFKFYCKFFLRHIQIYFGGYQAFIFFKICFDSLADKKQGIKEKIIFFTFI